MRVEFVALAMLAINVPAHAEWVDRTLTIDFPSESPDENMKWKGVDLETGLVTVDPKFGAPGWHIRFKEGYVSTNGGSVAVVTTGQCYPDQGKCDDPAKQFSQVKEAPTDASKYAADVSYDPPGPSPLDTYNETLMRWGDYFLWKGHYFAPFPLVFVIKAADGHYAKLQFLDYVKDGKHMDWVLGRDYLYRQRWKQDTVRVMDNDSMIHVRVRARFNTIAGDRALE